MQYRNWFVQLLFVGVCVPVGWSQEVVDELAVEAAQPDEASLAELREAMHRFLEVRIDDLDRVCQLSQQQRKKLKVAAKGAVERTLEGHRKRLRPVEVQDGLVRRFRQVEQVEEALGAPARQRPRRPPVAAAPVEKPPVPDKQAAEPAPAKRPLAIRANARRLAAARLRPAVRIPRIRLDALTEQRIWKNAVDRVLTDEQRKNYDKSVAQRRRFELEVATNQLVTKIDEQLLLAPTQREQMAKVVNQVLLDRLGIRNGQNRIRMLGNLPLSNIVRIVLQDDVEPVFSPAQLARWKDLANNNLMAAPAARLWRVAPNQALPAVPPRPARPR